MKGIRWQVGNGQSIRIYEDKWIPGINVPLSNLILYTGSNDIRVNSLIDSAQNHPCWNMPLVLNLFPVTVALSVLAIPLPDPPRADELVWPSTKTGSYSTKSGNHFLFNSQINGNRDSSTAENLHQGSQHLGFDLGTLLARKNKDLPLEMCP